MTHPKVSVIVPVFNRSFMIRDVFCSVSAQSYPDLELVVVDDGSTDMTAELEAFLTSARVGSNPVKFIRIAHSGVSRARNAGIRAAGGDYIVFLDSDDLLFPNGIQELVRCLKSSKAQFSLGRIVETDYALGGPFMDADPLEAIDILRRAGWMTHAALYRKEAILAVGGFDETLRVGEDTIFQFNMLSAHGEGAECADYVGVRRRHQFGHLSSSPDLADQHARMLGIFCDAISGNRIVSSSARVTRVMLLLAILYSIQKRSDPKSQRQLLRKYRDTCKRVLPEPGILRSVLVFLASDVGKAGRYASLGLLSAARGVRRGLLVLTRRSRRRELIETALLERIEDLAGRLELARP